MDNTYEWELSKENIQPLKHGRNVTNLVSALTTNEDHVKQQRHEQKKALELSILAYEGQDPLEQWTKYINWLEENYPKGGKEGDLLIVLEQCLEKVRDMPRYHSDPRLLEVYLRYLDLTENSPEWFQQLYGAGYFHNLSAFYINWAEALEFRCNYKEGTRVYQLGLENNAEPLAKLEESFKHYQARVASAVFKTMTTMEPTPTPSLEQNRNAFGELDSESGRAPSHRTGTTVRKFQNNRSLLPTGSNGGSKLFNRPVAVLEDENGQPIVPVPVVTGRGGLPIQSVMKAENVVKAGKWTEASGVVNEMIPVAPPLPTFQVHVDDEPVCPPSAQKKQQHEASFSLALKDKAGAAGPGGLKMHNPQSLFERENPKVKLMCDLNRMLVGSREFSFEQIRRQSYERAGRWPTATTSSSSSIPVATPTTPSRLLNVPQGSSGSCRSSGKKKKTPCKAQPPPVFKIPLMSQPPPPLKPNEKWHCNIELLYRHSDGRELSFEQVRAALYLSTRYPSVPQPTVTVESPPPETTPLPSPPETKKKETCEMACQTDLCGLDYDIVLVPRCKPTTMDQLEPPSAEKSAVNSNGPSPTVNTKQALSSVKSWFNSSVLVPATQPPLVPAPAKKSLFAIFKDPSMVEQVDSAPPQSPPPLPPPAARKPFAIFTEEEQPIVDQENVLPTTLTKLKLRRPLVAIDDENAPPPTTKIEEPETPTEDDFKENEPPMDQHQSSEQQPPTIKRQLSGILQPSIGIPCDPEGERGGVEEEEEVDGRPTPSTHVSRALFIEEDDQTRHYAVPVVQDLDGDFTVPSALAFARNLRVQSTPLIHQQRTKPLIASDEGTFVLPRGRTIQQELEQPSPPPIVDQENQQPQSTGPSMPFPPHLSARMGRGLSPIDEMSREYFSSSGSSAGGTTGQQSGLSLSHHHHHLQQAGRIYPAHFDPFDLDHRLGLLNSLSLPIEQRQGFQAVSGRQPWLRTHSSVQLGNGHVYVIKQPIGQGAYAKIYEAIDHSGGRKLVLKVQEETGGIWEFYITSELQRRLSDSATARSVMNVERGFFYDNGSVLVNEFLGHGNLLDLINHYRLKNCSMPEALVYHFALQLLSVVRDVHECGVLHADIKPDNIMLQSGLELFPPELWTTEDVLANEQRPSNVKLIDFGRSVDLTLYPDRSAFMHVFNDEKCPEMRDGRAWSYQLDYYGLATTIYTMLMGVHCKIIKVDSQWRLPNLKRGHNNVWKELTTLLLNCPHQTDLELWRRLLAEQLVATIKAREFNDKIRELERYFASK